MANPWRVSPSGRLRGSNLIKNPNGDGASAKIANVGFFGNAGNTLAATEAKDTAAISGTVAVSGSLNKAETGSDTSSMSGVVTPIDTLINYSPLIIPFDGANNGTTFTEAKGHALTAIFTVVTSTTQSKWGGASGYFDGSGAAISTPHSADLGMTGQIDFCVEFWIYLPTGSTGGRVIGCGTNWVGVNWGVTIAPTLVPRIDWGNTTVTNSGLLWGTPLSTNAWNFVKVSATGTVLQCWVNGVSQGTGVIDDTLKPRVSQAGDFVLIGKAHDNTLPLNAYLDDLRVTIGNSRVATNTTVPTAAFQTTLLVRSGALSVFEVGSDSVSFAGSSLSNKLVVAESGSDTCLINAYQTDALIANTQLLIHFDSGFVDEMGRTLTNHGVTTSSSPVKFGATAAYFNGSSWLSSPNSSSLDIGAGVDFTIECWLYLPTGSSGGVVLSYGAAASNINYALSVSATGVIQLIFGGTGAPQAWNQSNPAGIARDTWHFIKTWRSGTAFNTFVDGSSYFGNGTIATDTGVISGATLNIGRQTTAAAYFTGYIDELRLTIGNARTSTNTVVPTAPFINPLIVPAQASLSATESGQDIAAINGLVPVLGDLVVAELGSDVLSETGKTAVSGSLAIAEAITKDTLASSGKAAVLGSLDKAESGVDSLSANGKADVSGSLVIVETSADISAVQGSSGVLGVLCNINAYELIADNLFISANVIAAGKLETIETINTYDTFTWVGELGRIGSISSVESIDTFTWVGELGRIGSISSVESISKDSLFITGNVTASGSLNKTEATNDVADFVGVSDFFGQLIAVETGEDSLYVSNYPIIIGSLSCTEANVKDTLSARDPGRDYSNWNVPLYSGDSRIDSLLDDYVILNNIKPPRKTLYFSFDYFDWTGFSSNATAYSRTSVTAAQRQATIDIFAYIHSLTGIRFAEVVDAVNADIVFARADLVESDPEMPTGWAITAQTFGNMSWISNPTTLKFSAFNYKFAILIDTSNAYSAFYQADIDNPQTGNYGYGLILHELGHVLGLKHPFAPPKQYDTFAACKFSDSVMNYTGNSIGTSVYHPFDLLALEWLYKGTGIQYYPPLPYEGILSASESTSAVPTYYLRGWDTTSANFVYWQSVGTPNISPTSTIPSLVGTLTNVCVVGTMQS
jgi:hypothetical protein